METKPTGDLSAPSKEPYPYVRYQNHPHSRRMVLAWVSHS